MVRVFLCLSAILQLFNGTSKNKFKWRLLQYAHLGRNYYRCPGNGLYCSICRACWLRGKKNEGFCNCDGKVEVTDDDCDGHNNVYCADGKCSEEKTVEELPKCDNGYVNEECKCGDFNLEDNNICQIKSFLYQ